ncbi:hypothetical protein Pla175_52130 [Pirellulimonas nuda]|uniref:Uncharacterized protein n=1 Tax=Pirellulimonas nuda TaxID=2528009 RepID=A0A518DJZ8_9BACT|nr:hypothetical protein [Pirellulimonas nuda]QDU91782.1 hypothetical protein Pla175_52130 [Pirellulimonas nuda]
MLWLADDATLDLGLGSTDDLRRIDYMPSPTEIADACAVIRDRWTHSEKRRRFVGEYVPDGMEPAWRPPVIDTSCFRHAGRGPGDATD